MAIGGPGGVGVNAQGGAILNNGILTVANSVFTNNGAQGSAGGVGGAGGRGGDGIFFASAVAGSGGAGGNAFASGAGGNGGSAQGGAIANTGTLTVTGGTFTSNYAIAGAARIRAAMAAAAAWAPVAAADHSCLPGVVGMAALAARAARAAARRAVRSPIRAR